MVALEREKKQKVQSWSVVFATNRLVVEEETFEGTIAKRRIRDFLAPTRDARSLLQGMMVY